MDICPAKSWLCPSKNRSDRTTCMTGASREIISSPAITTEEYFGSASLAWRQALFLLYRGTWIYPILTSFRSRSIFTTLQNAKNYKCRHPYVYYEGAKFFRGNILPSPLGIFLLTAVKPRNGLKFN